MADEAKAKGNAAFSSRRYDEAVEHFTEAVRLAPENHVLYSNRSASYASLHKYKEALADAQQTVALKPDWAKGYSRLGAAFHGLLEFDSAVDAFERGLKIDPSSEVLKSGLADARAAKEKDEAGMGMGGGNPLAKAFQGPDFWARLHADPRTRAYLDDPAFRATLTSIQRNPDLLNLHLNDQRMMDVLGVSLGINIRTAGSPEEAAGMAGGMGEKEGGNSSTVYKTTHEPKPEPAAEPMEVLTEEEQGGKARKAEAAQEKELGNAAYKKKAFEDAIAHYSRAVELDDTDVTFLTNRAAVYLEMGKYSDCIADCDQAVERGRELHADYKSIARALTRKGTAFVKMAKTAKDYEPAIAAFNKALTEHRNPDTLKKLNEAERAKKELDQQEYFNPQLAEEEREKGNEKFKNQQFPEAVKHYTEALKRNPKDVKSFSNRAACYIKLGAMPEAKKDAEKCIAIDSTFVKGYLRKGAAEYFMKEYDKAMETYQLGLKVEPGNEELMDGVRSCVQQISKANRGELTPDELKERQAKAMQDPDIQAILTDPIMRQVLTDFQENPQAAMQHQKNPMVMGKIQKLVAAGIVQVR